MTQDFARFLPIEKERTPRGALLLLFRSFLFSRKMVPAYSLPPIPRRNGKTNKNGLCANTQAAALALPMFFSVWPQWLTPSRWSDFSWWDLVDQQLRQHARVWLHVSFIARDVAWKFFLLAQVCRTAVQLILCEILRCRLCVFLPLQNPV